GIAAIFSKGMEFTVLTGAGGAFGLEEAAGLLIGMMNAEGGIEDQNRIAAAFEKIGEKCAGRFDGCIQPFHYRYRHRNSPEVPAGLAIYSLRQQDLPVKRGKKYIAAG